MKTTYFLSSFEPEDVYTKREVHFERKIQCGNRDDYVVATVIPPFEGDSFGRQGIIETIIIAPRHKGVSLSNVDSWPIHVYVCTTKDKELIQSLSISPDDLEIVNWGLLDIR